MVNSMDKCPPLSSALSDTQFLLLKDDFQYVSPSSFSDLTCSHIGMTDITCSDLEQRTQRSHINQQYAYNACYHTNSHAAQSDVFDFSSPFSTLRNNLMNVTKNAVLFNSNELSNNNINNNVDNNNDDNEIIIVNDDEMICSERQIHKIDIMRPKSLSPQINSIASRLIKETGNNLTGMENLITVDEVNTMDVHVLNNILGMVVPANKGNSNVKREWRNVGWFTSDDQMNEVRKKQKVSKWKSVEQLNGLKVFFRCNKWKRTNCNYRMHNT